MLGMCVFLWGFAYKLSLYDLHQLTVHRIPEAKLISKNEDARAVEGVRQALASVESGDQLHCLSLLAVVTVVFRSHAPGWEIERGEYEAAHPLGVFSSAALYLRPPPIHSVS